MKLKLALVTAFLAVSASSVQADTGTPDILASVSSNSVQAMANNEAGEIRGEYLTCKFDSSKKYLVACKPSISRSTKATGWVGLDGYRWHLFNLRKYGFWGKKNYWHVSR
jgi:hypothetical protein